MSVLRVMIVEDEPVVARRLARLTTEILTAEGVELSFARDVAGARTALALTSPDLLILDLNLGQEEGFDLIRDFSSHTFETIVVSAHTDRALDAFDYGVRDFVPKPFGRERLEKALRRALTSARPQHPIRYLGVRTGGRTELVPAADILYIEGAGTRSELVLRSGRRIRHDRLLDRLASVLPPQFERIHKSYIVDIRAVQRFEVREGSRYLVVLGDGTVLPVGRTRVQALKRRFA